MSDDLRIWRRCAAVYGYGVIAGATLFVALGMPPSLLMVSLPLTVVVGLVWVIPAAAAVKDQS